MLKMLKNHLQSKYSKSPKAQLGDKYVFARGAAGARLATLGKEFSMPRHKIAVAVNDLKKQQNII